MQVRVFQFALWCIIGALLFIPPTVRAEDDFLARAIPLAQKSQRETTVPASVTLAQAMWETGRGQSPIGSAKNYFGIKAAGANDSSVNVGAIAEGWVWAWTKEWDGKKYQDRRERFRKYRSMEDSFRDHGLLLATTPRYASAMRVVDDPREFARRIAAAGYATSPTYAQDLIAIMDLENLYQYDLPRNAAQVISQSKPLTVNAGDIFQIYFEVKNTGFGTWSPTADYFLANVSNEADLAAKARQELDQLVLPERNKIWAITMFAPAKAGTYTTTWQLQHGGSSFGPQMRVEISVQPSPFPKQLPLLIGVFTVSLVGLGTAWYLYRRKRQKNRARS